MPLYFLWLQILIGPWLNWSNFENVRQVVGLLNENDVLLAEMTENGFAVMTAGQV